MLCCRRTQPVARTALEVAPASTPNANFDMMRGFPAFLRPTLRFHFQPEAAIDQPGCYQHAGPPRPLAQRGFRQILRMDSVSLPWLVTVLSTIAAVTLIRSDRVPRPARLLLSGFLVCLAVIAALLGARLSFDAG